MNSLRTNVWGRYLALCLSQIRTPGCHWVSWVHALTAASDASFHQCGRPAMGSWLLASAPLICCRLLGNEPAGGSEINCYFCLSISVSVSLSFPLSHAHTELIKEEKNKICLFFFKGLRVSSSYEGDRNLKFLVLHFKVSVELNRWSEC